MFVPTPTPLQLSNVEVITAYLFGKQDSGKLLPVAKKFEEEMAGGCCWILLNERACSLWLRRTCVCLPGQLPSSLRGGWLVGAAVAASCSVGMQALHVLHMHSDGRRPSPIMAPRHTAWVARMRFTLAVPHSTMDTLLPGAPATCR